MTHGRLMTSSWARYMDVSGGENMEGSGAWGCLVRGTERVTSEEPGTGRCEEGDGGGPGGGPGMTGGRFLSGGEWLRDDVICGNSLLPLLQRPQGIL